MAEADEAAGCKTPRRGAAFDMMRSKEEERC
ncbi:hypothetical protein M493_16035 [Geobacillus genomosp. 3]|uniref:Uncharacterized protein n=1 Tax=Geobacillus genomosp. 3 TaxID=1921421 RepID=S6A3V0_GEOG3|nr:hypothetical protein M493_16035 [Geobacillus genomosp. 3]